jgi:hypothetical protein
LLTACGGSSKSPALAACDAWLQAGIGDPHVSVQDRRDNLRTAVQLATSAASASGRWIVLESDLQHILAREFRHGFKTGVSQQPWGADLVEQCKNAGQPP